MGMLLSQRWCAAGGGRRFRRLDSEVKPAAHFCCCLFFFLEKTWTALNNQMVKTKTGEKALKLYVKVFCLTASGQKKQGIGKKKYVISDFSILDWSLKFCLSSHLDVAVNHSCMFWNWSCWFSALDSIYSNQRDAVTPISWLPWSEEVPCYCGDVVVTLCTP